MALSCKDIAEASTIMPELHRKGIESTVFGATCIQVISELPLNSSVKYWKGGIGNPLKGKICREFSCLAEYVSQAVTSRLQSVLCAPRA